MRGAGAGEGRGGPSVLPWGLHASAAPGSAAHRRQTVAMAAVAVLRNDSLQAFLQVRAGLAGGEGKVGGPGLHVPWPLGDPSIAKGAALRARRWSQTSGGAAANFAPNLGVKSVASAGGRDARVRGWNWGASG